MIFLPWAKEFNFSSHIFSTAFHALKQMMHVISWLYGRMRRGLLGWECQGQPVIYGEDSWHHLGLGLFHRRHFVIPIITAFSLLKVVSIAVIAIYGEDSWHHLVICRFHCHNCRRHLQHFLATNIHYRHFSACNLCRERLKPSRFFAFLLPRQYCCHFPHHFSAFENYQPCHHCNL